MENKENKNNHYTQNTPLNIKNTHLNISDRKFSKNSSVTKEINNNKD